MGTRDCVDACLSLLHLLLPRPFGFVSYALVSGSLLIKRVLIDALLCNLAPCFFAIKATP